MTTTLPYGETVDLLMELGFPVNPFTLDSATLGVLDDDYLDGTLIGDDVSPYAQSITVTRGRADDFSNFNAGTLVVTLRNDDRRFDPTNTSSPYYNPTTGRSGVTPRRKVTLICEGVTVFVGRITDIDIEFDNNSQGTSVAVIHVVDDFAILATKYITTDTTPTSELTSARITNILDRTDIAYPATTRDISTGTVTVGTQQIDANTNALAYLQQVAEAEWGFLFVNASGEIAFRPRQTYAFSNPQAFFNDNGTNLPYQVLEILYGSEFLYNRVVIQREGGTAQIATDAASQAEYGILTYSLGDMLFADDSQSLALADYLLGVYSMPTFWFDQIATSAHKISSANRVTLYNLEMADQIQLTRNFPTGTPATVTEVYSIERIAHSITPQGHLVSLGLYKPTIVYPFELDDAVYGVLDALNALT